MRRFERLAADLKRAASEAGGLGQGIGTAGSSDGNVDVGPALRRLERKIGQAAAAPRPAMSATEFRALGKLEP